MANFTNILNYRFRFGSSAMKCQLCGVYVHQDCKIQYTMACVPKSQGTPNLKNGKKAYLSDYVPPTSPMVPQLIVQCIDEVCSFYHKSQWKFTLMKLNEIPLIWSNHVSFRLKSVASPKKVSTVFPVRRRRSKHLKSDFCETNHIQSYQILIFMWFVDALRTFYVDCENHSFPHICGGISRTPFKLLTRCRLCENCMLQFNRCRKPIEKLWRTWWCICNGKFVNHSFRLTNHCKWIYFMIIWWKKVSQTVKPLKCARTIWQRYSARPSWVIRALIQTNMQFSPKLWFKKTWAQNFDFNFNWKEWHDFVQSF